MQNIFRSIFIFVLMAAISNHVSAQKKSVNEFAAIDKLALELPDSMSKSTDRIASYINSKFSNDKDKVRAIYDWVAWNIAYDVENMYAINFYEKSEVKISKPLETRKGICENYAALFTDICSKCSIKSYMIVGYTRLDGKADLIPHAWSSAEIDGQWFLFDPTWGSGYVQNEKFIKKFNNEYFKVSPIVLIKSHMPFDYLWQFLNYPFSNMEFYQGKSQQDTTKPFFNFKDSILHYENSSIMDRLETSAYRIEKNGVKNAMIFDQLHHIKSEIEHEKKTAISNQYNESLADYNESINLFNEYIQYKNHQFKPMKKDFEIQAMMDSIFTKFYSSKEKLYEIKDEDNFASNSIQQMKTSLTTVEEQIIEQRDWLKKYFSKNIMARSSMFYEKRSIGFGR